MNNKKKKIFFWSFISIPIALLLFFTLFYFYPDDEAKTLTLFGKILIGILIVLYSFFVIFYLRNSYDNFAQNDTVKFEYSSKQKMAKLGVIGFVTNFFDAIGIGSFATSIILLKLTKQTKNEKQLVGTLSVGHAIPTFIQAIMAVSFIKVELLTLVILIIAGVIGSYVGAMFANKIKLDWTQLFIGFVLVVIAIFIFLRQDEIAIINKEKSGGDSLEVWWKYILGFIIFFILGLLQALGIGLYAPAMASVSLLGLAGVTGLPIAAAVSAFVMPASSFKFIKDKNYDPKIATSFSLYGSYGVMLSYTFFIIIIKRVFGLTADNFSNNFNWIIIVAILYTAATLIYKFYRDHKKETANNLLK